MRRFVALAVPGAIISATALGGYVAYRRARPWYETWGIDPDEAGRLLPGDELIATPTGSQTRAITINAPAAAVWPWLVQMGYGRAGWYSYDRMDMRGKSATTIVPEWQSVAVGDIMPVAPGSGFEVVQVEPDRALVLYTDDVIVERQRGALAIGSPAAERIPVGLAASGAILGTQTSSFRATWSFLLEPIDGTTTRLVERARVEYALPGSMTSLSTRFMGFGVFVMMQRQLIGLKSRAEESIAQGSPRQPPPQTLPMDSGSTEAAHP